MAMAHEDEPEDLEGIDPDDELYAVAPRRVRKLISHDWAAGYVSPFRPTDEQRADEIMARTGVTHGSVVVDLGSGDGVLLIAAAKRGAHAIGYELSGELNETARRRACDAGLDPQIDIRAVDLTQVEVLSEISACAAVTRGSASSAYSSSSIPIPMDIVVMYLLPEFLSKIEWKVKLWLERAGSSLKVVTVRWPLDGLTAENQSEAVNRGYYIYSRQ